MNAQTQERHFYLEPSSWPVYLLALALVFNSFWRPQIFTGNNLPLVVIFALVFVVIWMLHGLGISGILGIRIPRIFWPMALYVFALWLSMVVRTDFAGRTIQLALRALVLLIMMLLISNMVPSVDTLERTLYIFIGGFAIVALYAIADYYLYHRYTLSLFAGLGGIQDKNASGYYLMIVLFFALFFLRSPRLPIIAKGAMLCAIGIFLAAMLLTLSRSALVGMIAGPIVVYVLYIRSFNKRWFLLLVALVIAAVLLTPSTFKERLGSTFNFEAQYGSSNSSRIILLKAGWRMFEDHPLFGVGMGRFNDLLPRYVTPREEALFGLQVTEYPSAINEYLDALNEGGILAFAGLLWLLAMALWNLHKRLRDPNSQHRYLVRAFAVLWWSQVAYFLVEWQIKREIFWFVLALTAAMFELIPAPESERAEAAAPAPNPDSPRLPEGT